MNRCDICKHQDSCVCVPYGCECFGIDLFEIDLSEHDKHIRKDEIDECFKKIEQRLNDDTEISFDLPVEEVLGEDIDMDDFLMLAERIVQEYKRLIFGKLREAKYQLKEQK